MIAGEKIAASELLDEFYSSLYQAVDAMKAAFKRRAREGLTQDMMASRLDIDKALISKRLNGRENLTLKTLSAMASALACRLSIDFVPYENLGQIRKVENPDIDFGTNVSDLDEYKRRRVHATSSSPNKEFDFGLLKISAGTG